MGAYYSVEVLVVCSKYVVVQTGAKSEVLKNRESEIWVCSFSLVKQGGNW